MVRKLNLSCNCIHVTLSRAAEDIPRDKFATHAVTMKT